MSVGKGGYNTKGKTKAQICSDGRKGRETQAARRQQNTLNDPPF